MIKDYLKAGYPALCVFSHRNPIEQKKLLSVKDGDSSCGTAFRAFERLEPQK